MSKTISVGLLEHIQSECQTRANIWALKLNYRKINVAGISQAANGVITTIEDHNIKLGHYVALDGVVGMFQINDVATATWSFHEVIAINSPKSFTIATDTSAFSAYVSDGLVHESYGFTAHAENIIRDGLLYRAETAYQPTAIATSDKLQIPTIEMEGVMLPLLSIDGISEDDILGGRLDFAEVRTQLVNYEDLSQGGLWLGRGYMGQITVKNDQYIAELRGLTQIASQQILEVYSASCRYDLGSRRCTVDLTDPAFSFDSTVTVVDTDFTQFQSGLINPDGFFQFGKILWTSGENAGLEMEIKSYTAANGVIELWQPMPFDFVPGDTFTAKVGCKKDLPDCRDKFNNLINHGGFPHLPGEDKLAQLLVPKRPEIVV